MNSGGLTVNALTEIPYLRTRLVAGAAGGEAKIAWAHVVEIQRPWEWLPEDDLLMTTGLNVPAGAEAQLEFVRRCHEARLSGVAIGEKMSAPRLTRAMLAEADAAGLPILRTAFEVPFVQLSRAVAGSSQRNEQRRLIQAARIYDAAREASALREQGSAVLARLARVLSCRLYVAELPDLAAALQGTSPPPEPLMAALQAELAERHEQLPGFLRIEQDGRPLAIVPVPSRRPRLLLAWDRLREPPPLALLQHVATVVALETERVDAARIARAQAGADLLVRVVHNRIDPGSAEQRLADHDVAADQFLIAAISGCGTSIEAEISEDLAHSPLPHVACRDEKGLLVLIPQSESVVKAFSSLVSQRAPVGFSDPLASLALAAEAVREARWASERAREDGVESVRYGDHSSLLGPRSLREARTVFDRFLGAISLYDEEHGTDLVYSLAKFLECNRSWKLASDCLSVHKQTLVYRIRRVEELSGRKLDRMEDVAQLWFAIQAAESLGLVGSRARAGLEEARGGQ